MVRDLGSYRAKRNFDRTPEPEGGAAARGERRFVIHKHSATADHYDLRLEHDGVLKSWAVPKGPSLNPDDKRFAAETEDHPLDYIDFEGVIPAGEYGGGPIIVWDRGTWAPMEDVDKSLAKGAFKFRLAGEKLNGGFMLARLKGRPGDPPDRTGWLLIKEHDLAVDREKDILVERPESVKTGRRIEELVAPKPKTRAAVRAASLKGAIAGEVPDSTAPQLASVAATPPHDRSWLHEIKFDGYRTLAHVDNDGRVRLITRSGLDWTHRYGDLPRAFSALKGRPAVIDGEIVVVDESGVSRFSALQEALGDGPRNQLTYYAFDLLALDGYDLRKVKLVDRKSALAQLLASYLPDQSPILFSDHVDGDSGPALFERATELGLEGIVSKKLDAPYLSGRSHSWIKSKALKAGEFLIAGYTRSEASGDGIAALGLAEWVDGALHYRGKVGTGFVGADLISLLAKLEPLASRAAALAGGPKDMIWVQPVVAARIHYGSMTSDGMLRHAVFKGLREATLTAAPSVDDEGDAVPPQERRRIITDEDLATIWVTNPTRRLFGNSGPTKLDIALYYAAVGDFMLPHIMDRPVSLVRCPSGSPKDCFFQRHAFTGMPSTVVSFATKNSDDEEKSYLTVEGAKGYLALAQFGVVEFHIWGTHRAHLEKPDYMVFDLDPGEGIGWREVVEAATHIGGLLREAGLVPFVKTSGGSGIHIIVPIRPKFGWKVFFEASSLMAHEMARTNPALFTTVMGKDNRKRRIFIDFHRNARSSTAAAPYTLRARPNLPASTPLSWSDLETIDSPQDLNYSSLPSLLTTSGDPWADINLSARDLPARFRPKA